jgi:hypothetical protein
VRWCGLAGDEGGDLFGLFQLNEVAGWARFTDAEREAILSDLPTRRSRIRPEKLAMFS